MRAEHRKITDAARTDELERARSFSRLMRRIDRIMDNLQSDLSAAEDWDTVAAAANRAINRLIEAREATRPTE